MKPTLISFSLSLATTLAMTSAGLAQQAEVAPEQGQQMANQRLAQAESMFRQSGDNRFPSPFNWSDEVIYQIVVDRFNDGDPSNNQNNIESYQRNNQAGSQAGLQDYRHGGDLKGITQRLNYLADLGVTSLWITPILKTSGSYHGYCTADYTDVDPGFGTRADLRELVKKAHEKGIKIVLDIVVNHLCNTEASYDDRATPFNDGFYGLCLSDLDRKEWTGGPNDTRGQRQLNFGPTFFNPLRNSAYFNRCGFKSGDAYGAGAGAVFGDFSGSMLDFNTMNWDFQKIFTAYHKAWIAEADVDGFRLDAAKHVTPDFVARFSTEVRDYAARLGKNNFFVIGEVADNASMQANYLGKMKTEDWNQRDNIPAVTKNILPEIRDMFQNHPMWPHPGLNAVYDFSHSGALREVFMGNASIRRIKNWFWDGGETDNTTPGGDYGQLKANGDTNMNWNLIEIHDWPRFLVVAHDEFKFRAALGYLFTTRGAPILYYGMEQGLDGGCRWDGNTIRDGNVRSNLENICNASDFNNHARYRQDMFKGGPWRLGSIVPEIDNLAGIGIGSVSRGSGDPYAATDHDLYKYVRKLIAIRKSCLPLRRGDIYFRAANDSAEGLLAFSRIAEGQENLVVVNTGFSDIPLDMMTIDSSINGGVIGRRYRNLFNQAEQGEVVRGDNGNVVLSFPKATGGKFISKSRSVAVFVPDVGIQGYDQRLDVSLCK